MAVNKSSLRDRKLCTHSKKYKTKNSRFAWGVPAHQKKTKIKSPFASERAFWGDSALADSRISWRRWWCTGIAGGFGGGLLGQHSHLGFEFEEGIRFYGSLEGFVYFVIDTGGFSG